MLPQTWFIAITGTSGAGGAQQRQQCRLLIKHVGNQRRKNEYARHRAAPDQQRRREHTSGQIGQGLAFRLHARQLRRRPPCSGCTR